MTDYYGGTWIVSVRPDGSRLVIDLARRELTEVAQQEATIRDAMAGEPDAAKAAAGALKAQQH